MSVDTLRRAAALMREDDDGWHRVADWLEATADYTELAVDGTHPGWRAASHHALTVARAYIAAPTPCPRCGGAGIVDTSPPGVEYTAPWLLTDTDCPRCDGTGEIDPTTYEPDIEES